MNESDLRVQKTRRLLHDAFIELVIERGYEGVSVRDITSRAKVGYKTFYRHYQDKETLLYAILSDMLQEAQATLLLPPSSPMAAERNTLEAVRFAYRYADLFRVLLKSPMAERLIQPLVAFGLSEGRRFFGGSDTPDELVAHHFVASMMSLIQWWLEQGCPYPPDQMAEYINRLVIRPISHLRDDQATAAVGD